MTVSARAAQTQVCPTAREGSRAPVSGGSSSLRSAPLCDRVSGSQDGSFFRSRRGRLNTTHVSVSSCGGPGCGKTLFLPPRGQRRAELKGYDKANCNPCEIRAKAAGSVVRAAGLVEKVSALNGE